MIRTIDLFAGIGGVRIGFESAGFHTVFANDFEQKCKYTYDLNFENTPLTVEDIRKIKIESLPYFDFLLGGFPCQPFSVAGYRHGFKDKKGRGNLFFDIVRIIEERQPIGFLLENVKNLENHDNGRTLRVITETLDSIGYDVSAEVLNTMDFGNLPQNRERIYIIGFRKDTSFMQNFVFPNRIKRTLDVKDILESPKDIDQKYYYDDKPLFQN